MKRNTPGLAKTYELADRLKIPRYGAVGILEMLWHHAGQFTPRGDLGSLPDSAIAGAVSWPEKRAKALIDALVESRWLDRCAEHRFHLHDWPEHCEYEIFRKVGPTGFLPCYGPVVSRKSPGEVRENPGKSPGKFPASREAMAKASVFGGGTGGGIASLASGIDAEEFVSKFMAQHPSGKRDQGAVERYMPTLVEHPKFDGPKILARHKEFIARLENPRFCPMASKWLTDGLWLDVELDRTPAAVAATAWKAPSLD